MFHIRFWARKPAVASSDKRKPALGGFAFVQITLTSWCSAPTFPYIAMLTLSRSSCDFAAMLKTDLSNCL
ncbi:hypothetical protein CRY00_01315 [Salmonella enterica]|nr:hypothetical protein [Salmonella enterica subsp. enterica serovar Pomona]EAN3270202.1 hypothetical protein [Salmonella enterica subsp. enterica serovar Oranienburg]EAO9955107.1 hypothetical protein [Salmonella enterica]ECX5681161.1 hypothetical protein [Salmonella enterica subsp. enterica serovar Newport]EDI0661662.1 hypothetical protein [Salmonella enterica subsp. enterica serovar Muenchen]EDJ3200742.1 hypothetical protein [Salmonella enterica subsp. enterica serovar Poona]EDQ9732258.1 hy